MIIRVLAWPKLKNSDRNPYTRHLYESVEECNCVEVEEFSVRKAITTDFDVLHLHWPDALIKNVKPGKAILRAVAFAMIVAWVRRVRRSGVVWTVHNAAPHGSVNWLAKKIIYGALKREVAMQLHLSGVTQSQLLIEQPGLADRPHEVIPHGLYEGDYKPESRKSEVRESLGIESDDFLIAHAGNLSLYKGTLDLLEAFEPIARDNPKLKLVMHGECEDDRLRREIIELCDSSPNIILRIGWLDARDLSELIAASDLVALPYRRILNSGSVFIPLQLGIPVVAPAIGVFPEMSIGVGRGWVRTYDGRLSPQSLLEACAAEEPSEPPDLARYSWHAIGQKTASVFVKVGRDSKSRRPYPGKYIV